MRRSRVTGVVLANVMTLVLLVAACGDSASRVAAEEPWNAVQVPTTQPFIVVAGDGRSLELGTVCLNIQVEGNLDAVGIEAGLRTGLASLGLAENPGAACDAELVVSGTGERRCASYEVVGRCCGGHEITGEMALTVDGNTVNAYPLFSERDPPSSVSQSDHVRSCPDSSEPIGIWPHSPFQDALEDLLAVQPVGVMSSDLCPLTVDVFWRLVVALHDENREIIDTAAGHLASCAFTWNQQGRPADAVPFVEAVPHLISAWTAIEHYHDEPVHTALWTITERRFDDLDARVDYWIWWEAHRD
jgi:hypothetical protein